MTDLDTLIAAHPDAVTSVRTHDGHVVSHTVIVDTDTGRQAHTFDAGRLVERTIDHGDGTGTRTTYRPDGTVDTVEQLTGLPIPEPEPPADDPLAAVVALLAQVTPDQLARVLALGVAVTEPESVDRLTTAVETGDLADGVAVVAEAAVTAQVSVGAQVPPLEPPVDGV